MRRAADYVLRGGFLHKRRAGDIADFQPALCGQPSHAADSGDGDDLSALHSDSAADPLPG